MRPEAVDAMLPFLSERFANPSGAHLLARDARHTLDEARDVLADALGAQPGEIVFAGGLETDNLAVLGVHDGAAEPLSARPSSTTPYSMRSESRGGRLVPVDRCGVVDLDALAARWTPTRRWCP